jgi:hypothetical protein
MIESQVEEEIEVEKFGNTIKVIPAFTGHNVSNRGVALLLLKISLKQVMQDLSLLTKVAESLLASKLLFCIK